MENVDVLIFEPVEDQVLSINALSDASMLKARNKRKGSGHVRNCLSGFGDFHHERNHTLAIFSGNVVANVNKIGTGLRGPNNTHQAG